MLELVTKGGPVMILLFLCSFWGVYTLLNQFLYFRNNNENMDEAADKIKKQLISVGKLQTVQNLRVGKGILNRSIVQAIRLSDYGYEEIQEGIQSSTEREIRRLEQNQQIVASIITISPILGLLGTVLGLLEVFNVISGGGLGDASALSGGIAEALITTVVGLTITVPFILLHRHYDHKIHSFVGDIQYVLNDVVRFCQSNAGVKP
jgi:biopolymer transport protein ExbB